MERIVDTEIEEVVGLIISDYQDDRSVNKVDVYNQPDKKAIYDIVEKLLRIILSFSVFLSEIAYSSYMQIKK